MTIAAVHLLMRTARRYLTIAAQMISAITATSCAFIRPARAPLEVFDFSKVESSSPCLTVLLPGRGGHPRDFERAGFAQVLADKGILARVASPDAHMGYYIKRTVLERIEADIVTPARAKGTNRVIIAGVSMGGLGALLYAQAHPDQVSAVIALAPFLGDREVIDEIAAAGGISHWKPTGPLKKGDYQREIWLFLQRYEKESETLPPVYLGWGTNDPLGRANRLFAEILPQDHVFTTTGGHDWKTWRKLWIDMLDRGALQNNCK